jgi:WD40 repeat protein
LRLLTTIWLRDHVDSTFLDVGLRKTNPSICALDWNGSLYRILVGTTGGEIVDLTYMDEVTNVNFHAHGHSSGRIRALCAHPSELLVASGGEDRSIRIWELGDVPALFCMLMHSVAITALDFSPEEGSLLAVGQEDGTISILENVAQRVRNVAKPIPLEKLLYELQPLRQVVQKVS